MTSTELRELFKKNNKSDWIIDKSSKLSKEILNKNYIPLQCKNCGHKKKHSLGNIKHTLLKNTFHCRCQICYLRQKKKNTSLALLARVELKLNSFECFTWELDKSKIKSNKLYSSNTPLPLICKNCKTIVYHSYSNIQTCTINSNHIFCQVCKLRKTWKLKIEQRTNGEYTMDVTKTGSGYKVIHKKCGNYYYASNPHLIRKNLCPFCFEDKAALNKMRDQQQLKLFVEQKSAGKLSFHFFDFTTNDLHVSCSLHLNDGEYRLNWNSFLRSKIKNGLFACRSCRKQRLRSKSFYEYNQKIRVWGLRIGDYCRRSKIDNKVKILHYCIIASYHPSIYASPYEVISKNKRCAYCFKSTSYHKDYHFIKNYIEMDEDRYLTQSGRKFRLLSTKEEIERQIRSFKHLASLKVRINELTCPVHEEYTISWGNFYYRNSGCRKCSKERNVSYAHVYYQALLEYFRLDYIPEFPIKINGKTTYRVDFKLPTEPNYLEIDSIIHVRGWMKGNSEASMKRDKRKDQRLRGNLERIKMYNNNYQILPMREQINTIESAFLERANRNNIPLTKQAIEEAKKDPNFFNHARIATLIKKLGFYHSNHIEFKSSEHINVLQFKRSNECEFYCTIHEESFKRNPYSVFKMHFICPVCVKYLYDGIQSGYYLSEEKIKLIQDQIAVRFKGRFIIESWSPNQSAYFFRTVVFPVVDNVLRSELYIPLRDLLSLPIGLVIAKLNKGEYDRYILGSKRARNTTKTKCILRYDPVKIEYINDDKRARLSAQSELNFNEYQRKAKLINGVMKQTNDGDYIDRLINENENNFKEFFHKTNAEAKDKLATYDRKIVPFFNSHNSFELHTPREKYSCRNQFLLIKDLKCSNFFYCSWAWMAAKKKKSVPPIQCQRKECFEIYYRAKNFEPGKIPQENILQIFKSLYHGQYYPTYPNQKIMVREPISITHLPSGTILNASFDNFRRGKFRSEYKNLALKELKKRFPGYSTYRARICCT